MAHLENIKLLLVHSIIFNSQYLHNSWVLSPGKSFGQLLNISPTNHIYTKTKHSIQSFHTIKYGLQLETLRNGRQNKFDYGFGF